VSASLDPSSGARPPASSTRDAGEPVVSVLSDSRAQGYEPWLFQTMLDELAESELGIGFIYTILGLLAGRHGLDDAVVVLGHESFGTQAFRLGRRVVDAELLGRVGTTPGVYCEPDVVSEAECDAVRTACQLSWSMHVARFSAAHDPLTNIANRRAFDAALQTAAVHSARYGWPFTMVLVDLNHFKVVNDQRGHAAGDHVLRQFGFALRQSVRSGDTAARIGGDEFAVILSNAEGSESAGFLERLRLHLKASDESIEFTTGAAVAPTDSTDPNELYRIADARLYEKKGIVLS
jgi:diguanylate cyclase (GGDEF)-like protein